MGVVGDFLDTGINLIQSHQTRTREDNAIRRRVKDMKAAGINPILAAGNPAASGQAIPAQIDASISEQVGNYLANKGQRLANQQAQQEFDERKRNINWYKEHNQPSDKPNSIANDIASAMAMFKNEGGLPGILDTAKTELIDPSIKLINEAKDYIAEKLGIDPEEANEALNNAGDNILEIIKDLSHPIKTIKQNWKDEWDITKQQIDAKLWELKDWIKRKRGGKK